jgi:hypothetical protein
MEVDVNNKDVLDIIYNALRRTHVQRTHIQEIHDVVWDECGSTCEIVLTTDDPKGDLQDWVIRAESITEAQRNTD